MRSRWSVWIDTGGTFTDCLARNPAGEWRMCKVLSTGAVRIEVTAPSGLGEPSESGSGDGGQTLEDLRVLVPPGAADLPPDFFRGFFVRTVGGALLGQVEHSSGDRLALRREPREGLHEGPHGGPHGGPRIEPGQLLELQSPEDAPLLAIRWVTRRRLGERLPPLELRLATTRGTNALLERKGARAAVFLTEGFTDLLRIGDQRRPDLFAVQVQVPPPVVDDVFAVFERVSSRGEVLQSLDLESSLATFDAGAYETAAVALLHSHVNAQHERALAEALRARGLAQVSVSSDLGSAMGYLRRAQTAAVDAYLAPVVAGYLSRVSKHLGASDSVHVMTSAGGLVCAEDFRAKDSLLSGPAGGVVGAAAAARDAGIPKVLAFDMGGTSTDVTRIDGDLVYRFTHSVAGVELEAPCLALETVAAGGGSTCRYERGALHVGPESAGASPGPACYGAGGPLTLTDINLLLGRLRAERFPIPLRREPAEAALQAVSEVIRVEGGETPVRERLLEGFRRIADERMAEAIRRISLVEGYDPGDYALLAFGGAGGQHACSLAALLGMRCVLVPPRCGLLSAEGLGRARIERFAEESILQDWDDVRADLPRILRRLGERVTRLLLAEGVDITEVRVHRQILEMRYAGQESTLAVDLRPAVDGQPPAEADAEIGEEERAHDAASQFVRRHAELFSHDPRDRRIELVHVRVSATVEGPVAPTPPSAGGPISTSGGVSTPGAASDRDPVIPVARVRLHEPTGWVDAYVYERAALQIGSRVEGPAIVEEDHGCTVVESGWRLEVVASGALVLRSTSAAADADSAGSAPSDRWLLDSEAVESELFRHRYESIAREMGELLRRTAISVNVRERLDFSCSVLDAQGVLVVNAPHIPVHLGALGLCVRSLVAAVPMEPGDVYVTNHPAYGGSHLPDVTVVSPVYADDGGLFAYVATRAHHAEIGGTRPGSMPPEARSLAEEGVVLPPTRVIAAGLARWKSVETMLSSAPYPTRCLQDNMADLRAMVAANRRGVAGLQSLARSYGRERLRRTMQRQRAHAADLLRAALCAHGDGVFEARESLDDGSPLAVTITVNGERAVFDFAGTAPVHPGNLNATEAVVHSVLVYVLRLMVRAPLPLNEGLLEPVEVRIPRGMLSPSFFEDPGTCPAVMGGNVETSQRLVDVLLKALRITACSQGTMNNVTFGNDHYGYYETVAGGTGAGPGFDGAHGVHSHMTNTRITDVEVVEHRYPVRVRRFERRTGSGGTGRWRGGDGLRREFEFLEDAAVSVLGEHRNEGPYGLEGGGPGQPGRVTWLRADGSEVVLSSSAGVDVCAGDRILLETPGGGGWGTVG